MRFNKKIFYGKQSISWGDIWWVVKVLRSPFITQGPVVEKFEKAIFWWRKAVEIAPEWSYYQVELAGLYAYLDEIDKARKTLEECLELKHPRGQCQAYLERLDRDIKLELPGFWREEIWALPE